MYCYTDKAFPYHTKAFRFHGRAILFTWTKDTYGGLMKHRGVSSATDVDIFITNIKV